MLAEKINDIIRGMPVTDLSENSFSSVRQPFWTRDQFIESRAARDSTLQVTENLSLFGNSICYVYVTPRAALEDRRRGL
jgi:hypothetical protein